MYLSFFFQCFDHRLVFVSIALLSFHLIVCFFVWLFTWFIQPFIHSFSHSSFIHSAIHSHTRSCSRNICNWLRIYTSHYKFFFTTPSVAACIAGLAGSGSPSSPTWIPRNSTSCSSSDCPRDPRFFDFVGLGRSSWNSACRNLRSAESPAGYLTQPWWTVRFRPSHPASVERKKRERERYKNLWNDRRGCVWERE